MRRKEKKKSFICTNLFRMQILISKQRDIKLVPISDPIRSWIEGGTTSESVKFLRWVLQFSLDCSEAKMKDCD